MQIGEQPVNVMDYGCGTGSATPYFFEILSVQSVIGIDPSLESVKVAQQRYGSGNAQFMKTMEYSPSGQLDLSFCNGVFHHIPPNRRLQAVDFLHRSLRRGGMLGFWENNPWNPGTRLVMKRIPFDVDAITLSAPESRRMLRKGGFEVIRTDFLFIFPRVLRGLRGIEPLVSRLPIGAQYQILCRKP
jgi:trans-aconitate methyltransferase